MTFDTPQILSILALITALGAIPIIKIVSSRAFKSNDDSVNLIKEEIKELKTILTNHENELRRCSDNIIRAQEHEKVVDQASDQIRNELNREVQLITQHIETMHNKITHIDEKLEKIRDRSA